MKTYSVLVLAVIGLFIGSAANAKYSGGTGEPNDPYRIASAEDLNDIGNHQEDWDKHFILVNDVNLAQYTGTQFNRIGTDRNNAFTGVFDGNDLKIWNFTWDSNGINYVGLFKYVGEGGQIKNLGMENVDVNAINGSFVGGLVGYNEGGTITNCYSIGSVSGKGFFYGGLVGCNRHHRSMVTNCYSSCNVSGVVQVGGLVGRNDNGQIINCYSTGRVSGSRVLGNRLVGGLVGVNYGMITSSYSTGSVSADIYVGGLVGGNNEGLITNCYSTGNVDANDYVGGLAGSNYQATIANCYSTSAIDGNDYTGGFVGDNNEGAVIECFWDIETSGQSTSGGGTGKTTAEMKTKSTFTDAGWDFIEIWGIGEHQTYPFLRTTPACDLNIDNKVDLLDLAILASHWLEGGK